MANRVLFVSGRCPHSKKVLLGIQQHSFLKELFKIVNVDTQPFPNYIKTVPCILINNQVITGNTVFEYFGKLVEGKKGQESRESKDELNESDQGQCTINEDGELINEFKPRPNRSSGSWWSGDIDGSEFAINKAASQVDDFSAGGTIDPKPSFGDVEGISKPTPNVDTFSSKSHKKVRKNTDPDR